MGSFLKGTAILASAALVGEVIEFLITLVLAKELGEYGLGKYMTIMPVVILVMIIASLELQVSISKFVAEYDKKQHFALLKAATKLAVSFMLVLLIFLTSLFIIIPVFHEVHPLVRWVILLLVPIVSISSIARGYFMGVQEMGKIAIANLFRRAMQLFILLFVFQMFDFPLEISLIVAISAIIGGELLVLLFLLSAFFLQLSHLKSYQASKEIPAGKVTRNLLSVSVPTTAMSLFNSLTNAILPFLIQFVLIYAGFSAVEATEHFGMVSGIAHPIGFFPAFIAHSLMTVLIPTVSQAYANNDQNKLLEVLRQVMFLTLLYGVPVCIGFYYFADELTGLFVKDSQASYYLQLLWPFYLMHYFTIPLQAFLIGLGLVKDIFLQNIWTTFVTFILIYLFGSTEYFQMGGVIIGLNTGALLLMLMHYLTVCKKIGVSLTLFDLQHK